MHRRWRGRAEDAVLSQWKRKAILDCHEARVGVVRDVAFVLFHKGVTLASVVTQAGGCKVAVLSCCFVEPLRGSGVLVH